MLIFCKTEAQREKAMKARCLLNRPIECFMFDGNMQNVKGVIYVSPDISESATVSNLQGAEIEAQAMKKESFLAFMVDVLWAAKNQTRRSDMIKVVIDAVERFLEEVQVGPEQLHTHS